MPTVWSHILPFVFRIFPPLFGHIQRDNMYIPHPHVQIFVRSTTFRPRTVVWQCRPSTRSGSPPVEKWGWSGGGAWRAPSVGPFHWARGTQEHSSLVSQCTTSKHTPPSSFWHRKTEDGRKRLEVYIISLCTRAHNYSFKLSLIHFLVSKTPTNEMLLVRINGYGYPKCRALQCVLFHVSISIN